MKGSTIVITYSRTNMRKSPTPGDWAGKVKKGNYEAWLKAGKADARVHQPAALSGSFVPKLKAGKG